MLDARNQYDPATALFLARCCEAAYPPVDDWVIRRRLGFQALGSCSFGDLLMYVGRREEGTVLVSWGTCTIGGWLLDSEAWLEGHPRFPGKVHHGFAKGADEVATWVGSAVSKEKPVWVTGHSLGGAIATLTAFSLHLGGWNVAPVYTFGCPHVGDPEFAGVVARDIESYRVVNDDDIVPHLPAGPGYAEHGQEIWFDAGSNCRPRPRWLKAAGNFFAHVRGGVPSLISSLWADHEMTRYIEALAGQVKERNAA